MAVLPVHGPGRAQVVFSKLEKTMVAIEHGFSTVLQVDLSSPVTIVSVERQILVFSSNTLINLARQDDV